MYFSSICIHFYAFMRQVIPDGGSTYLCTRLGNNCRNRRWSKLRGRPTTHDESLRNSLHLIERQWTRGVVPGAMLSVSIQLQIWMKTRENLLCRYAQSLASFPHEVIGSSSSRVQNPARIFRGRKMANQVKMIYWGIYEFAAPTGMKRTSDFLAMN